MMTKNMKSLTWLIVIAIFIVVLCFTPQPSDSPSTSQSIQSYTTPSNANIDEGLFFNRALLKSLKGKEVSIKIGVLSKEKRDPSYYWIEFDPLLPFEMTSTSMILPYVVVGDDKTSSITFKPNKKWPGCSSFYEPSRPIPDMAEFRKKFEQNCRDEKLPIRLHDSPSTVEASVAKAAGFSYDCVNGNDMGEPTSFPAISMRSLLSDLVRLNKDITVDLLDIDAQGDDTRILLHIGSDLLKHVRRVKLECQTGMYMYKTEVPNDCNVAAEFLRPHYDVKLEVNNCGLLEYNLYATRRDL